MPLPLSHLRWVLLFVGLALLMVGVEVLVIQSAAFGRRPDVISLGVTLDLVVGLPVLYYFLVARRFKLPTRSLFGVFGLALALTALILPGNHQQLVGLLRRSLLLVELGFVGYILIRINRIIRNYQQFSQLTIDFMQNLSQSLDTTLGPSRFNRILVSELAVLRYGLFGWAVPVEKTDTDRVFTSHRESGQIALTVGLITVGLIETLVVHLLLNQWNPTVAWFVTGLGLYGLLFFVADSVATVKRPVLVQADQIMLRFGLRGGGIIDRRQIRQIGSIGAKPDRNPNLMNGAFFTAPNVLITLKEPVVMTGMLGIQKTVSQIALFIDDKQTFINELTA